MSYREALKSVVSRWCNTLRWGAILTPPLVAFNDNIGTIQVVSGHSMSPTLNPTASSVILDVVYVSRLTDFAKGDIILLYDPIREHRMRIIKRVAEITRDETSVYVLGDNSSHSTDSRQFGYVPSCLVEGVVRAIVFPPWRVGKL